MSIIIAIIIYYVLFYGIVLVFEGRLAPFWKMQSWGFVPGDAFLILAIGEAAKISTDTKWAFVIISLIFTIPVSVLLTKRDQTFYVNGKTSISLMTHGVLGFGGLLLGATYHGLWILSEPKVTLAAPTKNLILLIVGIVLYALTLVADNYIPGLKMNEAKKIKMHAINTFPIWDKRAEIRNK